MATYRVSPTEGVDSAGRSGSTSEPWATWAYLDTRVSAASGDIYLQDSGTTARENIPTSLIGADRITLGVYGGSEYATISGADVATGFVWNATYEVWEKTIATGWNVQVAEVPLTFVAWASTLAATAVRMTDYSFSYDSTGGKLYIKSPECPDGCEVSARQYVIGDSGAARAGLYIEGLRLLGAYRHNVHIGTKTGARIRQCHFGVCGGQYTSGIYLGNHIDFYEDNNDWVIEQSVFEDAFDASISPQLRNLSNKTARGQVFRRNTIRRAGYAGIEATCNGTTQRIDGNLIIENLIEDCGRGWSGDRNGRGIMLSNNSLDTGNYISGFYVAKNTMRRCKTGILLRDTAAVNVIGPNEIDDVQYGVVFRQQVAASGHEDHVRGVIVRRASVAAYYVSGSNDGVHGSASATQAMTVTLTNCEADECAQGVVNTTNANATVTVKNFAFRGDGRAFNCSVGTFAETYSRVDEAGAPGATLDATSVQANLGAYKEGNGALVMPDTATWATLATDNALAAAGTYVEGVQLMTGRMRPGSCPIGAYGAVLPGAARSS